MSRETPQIQRECQVLPQTSVANSSQKRATENLTFPYEKELEKRKKEQKQREREEKANQA